MLHHLFGLVCYDCLQFNGVSRMIRVCWSIRSNYLSAIWQTVVHCIPRVSAIFGCLFAFKVYHWWLSLYDASIFDSRHPLGCSFIPTFGTSNHLLWHLLMVSLYHSRSLYYPVWFWFPLISTVYPLSVAWHALHPLCTMWQWHYCGLSASSWLQLNPRLSTTVTFVVPRLCVFGVLFPIGRCTASIVRPTRRLLKSSIRVLVVEMLIAVSTSLNWLSYFHGSFTPQLCRFGLLGLVFGFIS
jgi:hypothetical protein